MWDGNLVGWNFLSGTAWEYFDEPCPAVLECGWNSISHLSLELRLSPPDDFSSKGSSLRLDLDWTAKPTATLSWKDFIMEDSDRNQIRPENFGDDLTELATVAVNAGCEFHIVVSDQPVDAGTYMEIPEGDPKRRPAAAEVLDDNSFSERVILQSLRKPVVAIFTREGCWACSPAVHLLRAACREDNNSWSVVVVDGPAASQAAGLVCLEGYPMAAVFHRGEIVAQHHFPTPTSIRQCIEWSLRQPPTRTKEMTRRVEALYLGLTGKSGAGSKRKIRWWVLSFSSRLSSFSIHRSKTS